MLVYADTSALAKYVLPEQESHQLRDWVRSNEARFITCDLTTTELIRAVRRANPSEAPRAFEVLAGCGFIRLDPSLFEYAARLDPPELRSLDALHLTAAIHLQSQLRYFLSYDHRLIDAARNAGLRTISPGAVN